MAKKKSKVKTPKWKSENILYTSFNKMSADLARGYIDTDQMLASYTSLVKIARARVSKTMKSALPYGKGHIPTFKSPMNIITESELAHEYTDVVKFLLRENTTQTGRMKQFRQVQKLLRKQGFNLSPRNFQKFVNFMDWFYSSSYAGKYDSNADITVEVFNKSGKTSPSQWNRLFKEYQESGDFD